ncbi:MAG: hypothetical protein EZS28_004067 [Streblomastix strix]|uniref:Uncharacterized protein n=1 Tax=Streblomastix strix TaxID=222440 RepID=A0A5J4WZI4_9EUKA|nr:MAG: hypothetical protein EZS28_004067 [Streblomastix strix]
MRFFVSLFFLVTLSLGKFKGIRLSQKNHNFDIIKVINTLYYAHTRIDESNELCNQCSCTIELNWIEIADIASSIHIHTFIPQRGVKIDIDSDATTEVEQKLDQLDDKEQEEMKYNEIVSKLPSIDDLIKSGIKVNGEEFEKDYDTNHHIDFITAGSNLRAINYAKPIEKGSSFTICTIWHRIHLQFRDVPTLGELINRLKVEKQWKIDLLNYKAGLLYGYFQSEEKMKIQKSKLITILAEQLDGKQLANGTDVICVEAQTDTGDSDIGEYVWLIYPPNFLKMGYFRFKYLSFIAMNEQYESAMPIHIDTESN